MGVVKEGLSAWPETVAFKRLLRNMLRAQDYVPPFQPTTVVPPQAEAVTAADGATAAETVAAAPAGTAMGTAGETAVLGRTLHWTLQENDDGDLVLRHTSGAEVVIEPNPERTNRG